MDVFPATWHRCDIRARHPITHMKNFVVLCLVWLHHSYRKTSSINRTKSQNINVSCLLLHWSLSNPLKPCVKLRMKMCLRCPNYISVINNLFPTKVQLMFEVLRYYFLHVNLSIYIFTGAGAYPQVLKPLRMCSMIILSILDPL